MQSTYQEITQQYAGLKTLALDANNFLQDPKNYAQFDANIRNAILETPDSPVIPAYIKELPQVKLIKNIRHSIQTIANDFERTDYTKFPRMIYHLQNFWGVAKAYLQAEKTICLSPEFNSKMLSLINLLLQYNQVFREELTVISSKPNIIFNSPEIKSNNNAAKKWHYYHEKVKALQKVLSNDNKLKPYIQNLEYLLSFMIDLKEKGILKSNPIATILDFIESFNKVSRTSIKEILQEYAILSEIEIQKILQHINQFWNSFLPICDEIEINMGLTTGYLTQGLFPVFQFCNILEFEFNLDNMENTYPFTENRLSRIEQGMNETNALLLEQSQRKQKLTELNQLIVELKQNEQLNPEKLVTIHQLIQILNCDESLKENFHRLINEEVVSQATKLTPAELDILEFNQLINKYKLHQASLEEARRLFSKLQDPSFAASAQNHYEDFLNEYTETITNFEKILEKIEKAKLRSSDIKHLLIMIHGFDTQAEAEKKSEMVKLAINNQIYNLEQLQAALNLFEKHQLPEQDFYQLLALIDFLDCDFSIKKKYKKQIADLDHKRKNRGYLNVVSDFVTGFFTEVTVPFSEIRTLIQDKKDNLQTIINENVKPVLTSSSIEHPIEAKTIPFPLIEPIILFSKDWEWDSLKRTVNHNLAENEQRVLSIQSIQSYQTARYEQLKMLLQSYKQPILLFDEIEKYQPIRRAWDTYITSFFKSVLTKATSFITSVYSNVKKVFSYAKSFFVDKEPDLPPIEIQIKEPITDATHPQNKLINIWPYKELSYIEDKIAWFFVKIVDPVYYAELHNALQLHKMISLTNDMPYFYRQGAEIVNTFILFRKVILSYSHLDLLQLTLAVSKMNIENKILLKSILEDSTLAKSSSFYEQNIKPTLANSYQTITNLKPSDNFTTSLPQVVHTVHNGIKLVAQNQQLNLTPFLAFLKRVEINFNESNKSKNPDLMRLYAALNKLSQFIEKVLNNQDNFLVEVMFSLADLSRQFQQVSTSITELLIKDQFPYLKELSEIMINFQDLLSLFHKNIDLFKAEGLHPNVITSLKDSVTATESLVNKLTPMEFQKSRILLTIDQIQSSLIKYSLNRPLKNELHNIHLLLTTKADQKLIDQKVLDTVETRVKEIKKKISKSYSQGCFGLFSRFNPFGKANKISRNPLTYKPKF